MSANVSPVAWYGGKSRLSSWLAGLLPRHDSYVEVFGGGASVLFAKPRATLEVYNDTDGGLVTFFRLLRDRPSELQHALRLTPYARSEYEHCRDTWELVDDELERARRWYARTQMAFACSASSGWGFEVDGAHSGGTRASGYATAVDSLHRFAERFRRVQVDQLHWRDCLARYDRPGAALYLDPPYHPDTRGRDRRNAYRHDLDAGEHEQLLARAVELKASVLISGYPHPLYDSVLAAAGFERFEHAHNSTAARSLAGRGARVEVLWDASNPASPSRSRCGAPDKAPPHNRRHSGAQDTNPNRRTDDRHANARACTRAREAALVPASLDPRLAVWFTPEDIRTSKEGSAYHEKAQTASDEALEEAALDVLSDSDWLWTVYGEICCEIIDRACATAAERAAGR